MSLSSIGRALIPAIFRRVSQAVAPPKAKAPPPPPFCPAPVDGGKTARKALEQRFAERILENEALVGDLTGAQYTPIQDRALVALRQAAANVQKPGTPAAEQEMEKAYARIVGQLRAEVKGAEAGAQKLEERFTERLYENEALPGDLTDDEYIPIVEAAARQVKSAVENLGDPGAAGAEAKMEETFRRIVGELRAKVAAAGG
ncbi:MAG: hypothetical protein ACYC8T_16470 [Myxococcaceae bacterium]